MTSNFVVMCWVLCLATSAGLMAVLRFAPYLIVKPSVAAVAFFHLFIQWAATTDAAEIEHFLPDPMAFLILAEVFPLVTLAATAFLGRRLAQDIWSRLGIPLEECWDSAGRRAVFLLVGVVLATAIVYLRYVPFSSTGLVAIMTDPENAAQARENSMKLLDSQPLKYALAFATSAFAPILGVMASFWAVLAFRKGKHLEAIVPVGTILVLIVAVSVTGARSMAANLIMTILTAGLFKRQLKINYLYLAVAALAVLTPPTILSIWREGVELNPANYWKYLSENMFGRVFYGPMETGLWYVHYAQTVKFIGIGGVEKLADLVGVQPVNAPNLIGLTYIPAAGIRSINANTSFVFSYYSYFGMTSVLFSLPMILSLDLSLLVQRSLGNRQLTPCVAAVTIASLAFVFADFTTALLTNGFLVVLALSMALDRYVRPRRPRRNGVPSSERFAAS